MFTPGTGTGCTLSVVIQVGTEQTQNAINTVTNTPGAGVLQYPPGNFGVECVRTLAGARVDQSLANVDQPLANRCLDLSLHAGRTVSQARAAARVFRFAEASTGDDLVHGTS